MSFGDPWILVIPRPVPSANERQVNGRDRISRALYRRLRNAWAQDLIVAARIAGVPAATGPRRITLTRLMGPRQRAFDYDDLVGGAKPILDALRPPRASRRGLVAGAALIRDDSAKWVTVEYRQERGEVPACRLEIWDEPREN